MSKSSASGGGLSPSPPVGKTLNSTRVLEAVKLTYANKTKQSVTSLKLGLNNFWQIANCVLNRGKSAVPPLINGPLVLSSVSDKAKFFTD